MWVVGIAVLLLLVGTLSLLVNTGRDKPPADIWDVVGTARTYTSIVGTLAGFSVTSSIFIAGLAAPQRSAAFEGLMALFLIAFLIFIGAAMEFGTTPNLPTPPSDEYRTIQGYSYLLANTSYYVGLSLSWLGLPLLLSAIGLQYLAGIVIWLVLLAIVGGGMRICSAGLNNFARADLRRSLALPVICFAVAAVYALVLGRQSRDLLPNEHGRLFLPQCALSSLRAASLYSRSSWARFAVSGHPLR
jgi:hypothetical protein